MADLSLTAQQEADAQKLAALITEQVKQDVLGMARLLVSKPDAELLGKTEFEIRDRVHKIGARAIETALDEREKGGTTVRA